MQIDVDRSSQEVAVEHAPIAKRVIPVVVGTRPEAIKLVPIILALRESERFHPIVVSTGQHHRMVGEIFELAGITPDVDLWVGDAARASTSAWRPYASASRTSAASGSAPGRGRG